MPKRSKHPLLTGHTRREPSYHEFGVIRCQSQCAMRGLTIDMKNVIFCNYELDHCNGHKTCQTPTSNETVEIPVLSTCLSIVYPDSKTAYYKSWPGPIGLAWPQHWHGPNFGL